MLFKVMCSHHIGLSSAVCESRVIPGSDLGSGSLPHPPRLGALPAVPRHPVRALALLRAVPRARAAGGAVAAPLQVLLRLPRRRRGQAGRCNAARAAAQQAQRCQCLQKVGVVGDSATARHVERGGPSVEPACRLCDHPCAVGATLQEQLNDCGVVVSRGVHERSEAGACGVAGRLKHRGGWLNSDSHNDKLLNVFDEEDVSEYPVNFPQLVRNARLARIADVRWASTEGERLVSGVAHLQLEDAVSKGQSARATELYGQILQQGADEHGITVSRRALAALAHTAPGAALAQLGPVAGSGAGPSGSGAATGMLAGGGASSMRDMDTTHKRRRPVEAVEEDASSDSDSGEKNGGDRNDNTDDSDDSESDDPDPDNTARHTGEMAAHAKGKAPETGAQKAAAARKQCQSSSSDSDADDPEQHEITATAILPRPARECAAWRSQYSRRRPGGRVSPWRCPCCQRCRAGSSHRRRRGRGLRGMVAWGGLLDGQPGVAHG